MLHPGKTKYAILQLALLILTTVSPTWAEPVALDIGQPYSIEPVSVTISGPVAHSLVWTYEYEFEITPLQSFAFRINSLHVPEDAKFSLQVLDRDLTVIQSWGQQHFVNRPFLWSAPIIGRFAFLALRIEVLKDNDTLSFEIDEIVLEKIADAQLESIVGVRNFQHMYEFINDNSVTKAGKSVAKLSFVRDSIWYTCTGFMISDDLLLTNEHCVNSQEICHSTTALFGYEWERDPLEQNEFRLNTGQAFTCAEFLHSDVEADWSLIRMVDSPGLSSKWGHLTISEKPVTEGVNLILIQHPAGYPKIVTKEDCRVTTDRATGRSPDAKTDFGHVCDSIKGSSGAPLVDSAGIVFGQHHWGFDTGDSRWSSENRAIHITEFCSPTESQDELPRWPLCQ